MRKIYLFILLLVLASFIYGCTSSYQGSPPARFDVGVIGNSFGNGLSVIENFFSGGWQSYEKTIAFFVFFLLFFSAYLIGLKKAFGGEMTRAHMTFAFVAAFTSAFIIVITMRFDWMNLTYVAWALIGVLILFSLYTLFSKFMENNKFWAFILALILTLLLLWGIWYLMQDGRPWQGFGRVNNWFGSLKGTGTGEGTGGAGTTGGGTDLWPGGVPPKPAGTTPTTPGGTQPRDWSKALIALAIVLALAGGGGAYGIHRWRRRRRGPSERTDQAPTSPGGEASTSPLGKIRDYLVAVIKAKEAVIDKLDEHEERKSEAKKNVTRLADEILRAGGIEKFLDKEAPLLRDPRKPQYKEQLASAQGMKRIVFEYREIVKWLKYLFGVENNIIQRMNWISHSIMSLGEEGQADINKELSTLAATSHGIIEHLGAFFDIEKKEAYVANKLYGLLDDNKVEERIQKTWLQASGKGEAQLGNIIDEEIKRYGQIRKSLVHQIKIVKKILELLYKREPKEISIISPSANEQIGRGGEVYLEADVKGLDLNNPDYHLAWFIMRAEDYYIGIRTDGTIKYSYQPYIMKLSQTFYTQKIQALQEKLNKARPTRKLQIQEEINRLRISAGDAIGNKIYAVIPPHFATGKAVIWARVYYKRIGDQKPILSSDVRTVNITEKVKKVEIIKPTEKEFFKGEIVNFVAEATGITPKLRDQRYLYNWEWFVDQEKEKSEEVFANQSSLDLDTNGLRLGQHRVLASVYDEDKGAWFFKENIIKIKPALEITEMTLPDSAEEGINVEVTATVNAAVDSILWLAIQDEHGRPYRNDKPLAVSIKSSREPKTRKHRISFDRPGKYLVGFKLTRMGQLWNAPLDDRNLQYKTKTIEIIPKGEAPEVTPFKIIPVKATKEGIEAGEALDSIMVEITKGTPPLIYTFSIECVKTPVERMKNYKATSEKRIETIEEYPVPIQFTKYPYQMHTPGKFKFSIVVKNKEGESKQEVIVKVKEKPEASAKEKAKEQKTADQGVFTELDNNLEALEDALKKANWANPELIKEINESLRKGTLSFLKVTEENGTN
jgi:hypothetical protein